MPIVDLRTRIDVCPENFEETTFVRTTLSLVAAAAIWDVQLAGRK